MHQRNDVEGALEAGFRRHPVAMLAAAAAAGFVASRMVADDAKTDHDAPARRVLSVASPSVSSTLERMFEALVAAASIRAAEYIEQWLPGFHEEFSRRHT